jgi:hypothetical protein
LKKFFLVMAAFFGAAGLSYGLSLLGYILYSEATDFYDREGAIAMAVAFFIGPVVALVCGIVAAVWTARRA